MELSRERRSVFQQPRDDSLKHDSLRLTLSCSKSLCLRGGFTSEVGSTSDDRALISPHGMPVYADEPGGPSVASAAKVLSSDGHPTSDVSCPLEQGVLEGSRVSFGLSPSDRRPHVVVLGAGFGGLNLVKTLAPAAVDITLIDRTNHTLFQPLLYQVATAALAPSDIAVPIRSIFSRRTNVTVLMGDVEGVDTDRRFVSVRDTGQVPL